MRTSDHVMTEEMLRLAAQLQAEGHGLRHIGATDGLRIVTVRRNLIYAGKYTPRARGWPRAPSTDEDLKMEDSPNAREAGPTNAAMQNWASRPVMGRAAGWRAASRS